MPIAQNLGHTFNSIVYMYVSQNNTLEWEGMGEGEGERERERD
jgi:hypothetical protein